MHNRRALSLLVAILSVPIAVEILLRIFFPVPTFHARTDGALAAIAGWGPTLGADGKPLCDFPLTTKKPGKRRILLLGDSVLDCNETGQRFENTIPYRLAATLDSRFEVHNLSAGGWGTDQQLLAYEAVGDSYNADEVLLFFTPSNDLINNTSHVALGESRSKPNFFLGPNGELMLQSLASNSVPLLSELMSFEVAKRLRLRFEDTSLHREAFRTPETPRIASAWRLTEKILERLKRAMEKTGARLTVVYNPTSAPDPCRAGRCLPYQESSYALGCETTVFDLLGPLKHLRTWAKTSDTSLVELQDLALAQGENLHRLLPDCLHFGASGASAVSQSLKNLIENNHIKSNL